MSAIRLATPTTIRSAVVMAAHIVMLRSKMKAVIVAKIWEI
jgi:hypothetical protein